MKIPHDNHPIWIVLVLALAGFFGAALVMGVVA